MKERFILENQRKFNLSLFPFYFLLLLLLLPFSFKTLEIKTKISH